MDTQQTQITLMEDQISGKKTKLISQNKLIVYKTLSQCQQKFYQLIQTISVTDTRYSLKKYLPQYKGCINKIKIQDQETSSSPNNQSQKHKQQWMCLMKSRIDVQSQYIKLTNFNYGFAKANLMDIKLGTKKYKASNRKFIKSTTNSKKFRINGMSVLQTQAIPSNEYFINKYYGQTVEEHQIQQNLAFFFYNGVSININLIKLYLEELKKLILSLRAFTGIRFLSSSLLFSYDALNLNKYLLKLIDFDKCSTINTQNTDDDIILGIINVHFYLSNIIINAKKHQQAISNKILRLFNWLEDKEKTIKLKTQKINQ